jgi:hypothetical protein
MRTMRTVLRLSRFALSAVQIGRLLAKVSPSTGKLSPLERIGSLGDVAPRKISPNVAHQPKPFSYDALVFLHRLVSTHASGTESGHMLVVVANGRNTPLTLSLIVSRKALFKEQPEECGS